MPKVNILQYPDKRLRRSAPAVVDFGSETQAMVDAMFDTLYASENCAALAATQLDFKAPLHVTVIDFSEGKNQPLCLINAKIIDAKGSYTGEEGCMSVAGGIYEKVTRPAEISVEAKDRYGKPLAFYAQGFMAKCIQHELDHLQGRLFIDYLSPLKQKIIAAKVHKARKKKLKTC